MPIYEYACQSCEHQFEELVFEEEPSQCPSCGSEKLQKQWSVPARPQTESIPFASGCDPSLPPCSPMCRRTMTE